MDKDRSENWNGNHTIQGVAVEKMAIVRVFIHGGGAVSDWVHQTTFKKSPNDIVFKIGEKTDFRPSEDPGWKFQKWCNGETPPYCVTDYFLVQPVTIEYGEVHAYFTEDPGAAIERERQERQAADTKLSDRIAALEKWAGAEIMEVLASIQDMVERSEQEATAWRDAFAKRFDGLEAWLTDRIIGILLAALDKAVMNRGR